MDARTLTGAETFLRMLSTMGIERIFASPGSEWAPVWEYLAKTYEPGTIPQYTSTRHEEVALGMASGYYKTTGKLAAVMIHTTVGSLHGAMALRGALHENVPMVVFTGESVGFGHEAAPDPGAQWQGSLADVGGPARLLAPCVKWSFGLNAISALGGTVQRACQIATAAPRGPVFVSLPMEYLFNVVGAEAPAAAALPIHATAAPAGIEQLADMLAGAKQPVIVTERAGENPKAVPHLVAIAELLGAPVAEARGTKFVNFPRSHGLHAGFNALAAVKDADVVFCLSTIAPWHPSNAAPAAGARVALLDENPLRQEKPVWGYQCDLCLFGEVEGSLAALLDALKKRVKAGDAARATRAASWAAKNNARRQKLSDEALALANNTPLDERYVAHEINQLMPADVIYVDETITTHGNLLAAMDKVALGGYIQGAVGGLGTGLGTALGAKAGHPKRPVVCMIGDGSFNYNPVVGALGCAQEHNLPLMFIIFNNYGYQSQQGEIPHFYPGGHTVTSGNFKASGTAIKPNPDYAALAPIYGGYGEKVEKPGEVRAALERGLKALSEGKLVLLDMRLKPVQG
jgi:acetolactate synthase-1/2/3 large subunit